MKGQTFEGGIRVPFIARLPGVIPAGKTSHQPAIIMDIFPTVLGLCGGGADSTKLDGLALMPVLKAERKSPHAALFFFRGERLCAVRSGKWKLHVCPNPNPARRMSADEKWTDPRAPDGVRILAPYEQSHPSEHPGLLTGDIWKESALFDLENDPGEQHNIIGQHSDVAESLARLVERTRKQMAETMRQGR
jgi:arylsulfatase A-like enzyme